MIDIDGTSTCFTLNIHFVDSYIHNTTTLRMVSKHHLRAPTLAVFEKHPAWIAITDICIHQVIHPNVAHRSNITSTKYPFRCLWGSCRTSNQLLQFVVAENTKLFVDLFCALLFIFLVVARTQTGQQLRIFYKYELRALSFKSTFCEDQRSINWWANTYRVPFPSCIRHLFDLFQIEIKSLVSFLTLFVYFFTLFSSFIW